MNVAAKGAASLALLLVATLVAVACGSSDTSRLSKPASTSPGDDGEVTVEAGTADVTLPSTTAPVDGSRSIRKSPNQESNCAGAADSFIPESGDGWEVVTADISAAGAEVDLGPAEEKGLESIGAAYIQRGASGGSVVSMVFEPGMAGLLSASTDVVMRGMFAAGAAEKDTVAGALVYRSEDEKMFAFQFCNNVYMTVQSDEAGLAREITDFILG
ncbi:MAG: hypothetical protein IT198_12720 [Acidimicrobiia bacterium]|nr:hypothetical protein [Acidimicrobiia bacterium]